MKKRIKKLWIEALKSGEYSQGKGRLRRQDSCFDTDSIVDSYCCLGVLCDVLEKNKIFEKKKFKFKDGKCITNEGSYGCELPHTILEALKMTPKSQEKLVEMNDSKDKNF